MDCREIEELLPAYALGALEPGERQDVEEHLGGCPQCSRSARAHLETAAMLAQSVPEAEPPASVWQQIQERIGEEPPVPAESGTATEAAEQQEVRRLSRSSTVALSLAAGFALALFGVLAVLLVQLRGELGDVREENQNLVTMIQDQRSLSYYTALPETDVLLLASTDLAPRARGMLITSGDRRWGYVVVDGLQQPEDGMAYRVWLMTSNGPTDGGTFTVDSTGYGQKFVRFPRLLDSYSGLEITMEQRQGAPSAPASRLLTASFP